MLDRNIVGALIEVVGGVATFGLVGGLAGLGGVLTFAVITFINGLPALQAQLGDRIDAVATWPATGLVQLSAEQLSAVRDTLLVALNANPAAITTGHICRGRPGIGSRCIGNDTPH